MKKIIFIITALIMINLVIAIDYNGVSYSTFNYDDDFEYTDSFQSRNYTLTENFICVYPEKPFSVNGDLSMGYTNLTSNCGLNDYKVWERNFNVEWSGSGRAIARFDLYRGTNMNFSNPGGAVKIIMTLKQSGTNALQIAASQNMSSLYITNNIGGADCSTTKALNQGANNELAILLDGEEGKYSVWINGVDSGCGIISLGSGGLTGIKYSNRGGAGNIVDYGFAFVQFYSTESSIALGSGQTGDFCLGNTNCTSGYCDTEICRLKPAKYNCSASAECLSGRCFNNRCAKASAGASLGEIKDIYFGDDLGTNLLIALLLIIIPSGIIWATTREMLSGLITAVIMILSTTIFGLIPYYITIGMFLIFAIIAFVIIYRNQKG